MSRTGTISQLTSTTEFTATWCGVCGVAFALTADMDRRRREDHQGFWCPNGHSLVYNGKSEAEQLREQLEASRSLARRERERREATERSRAAVQGVATKRAKQLARVRNGVCPCCNRSFADLHRHMAGQHPEYHPGGV